MFHIFFFCYFFLTFKSLILLRLSYYTMKECVGIRRGDTVIGMMFFFIIFLVQSFQLQGNKKLLDFCWFCNVKYWQTGFTQSNVK